MSRPKILIVDDEPMIRRVMTRVLGAKYDCLDASDAEMAMAVVAANPDLALLVTDYKMPGENGIELIRKAKAAIPSLGCILITAFGEIELAVEAMKEGADDFLTKPITDMNQMELRIAKAIKTTTLEREVANLKSQLDEKYGLEAFTGSSEPMKEVYRLVRLAAPSNATVLIEGPSGTGKELVAQALHRLSPRASGPFVAVECAALSATLLESELFGHEKGSFTDAKEQKIGRFEAANGGTLFLDEIGEIDLSVQVKLLRVLESRRIQRVGGNADISVDFRLVAATNKDLAALVAEGKFREDLYYRLNVIEIRTPPLKDRPGDVVLLARRFLDEFSKANGGRVTGFEPAVLHALERYPWPGNVRQLRNVIERMTVLSAGPLLTTGDLPAAIRAPEAGTAPEQAPPPSPCPSAGGGPVAEIPAPNARFLSPNQTFSVPSCDSPKSPSSTFQDSSTPHQNLAETEKEKILSVLADCRGNKTKAAELLGISRRTLHRKLNAWHLR